MKKNIIKLLTVVAIVMLIASTTKPVSVFLIGDSISINYYLYLKEYVKDFAFIDRKQDDGKALQNLDVPMGANGGDSRMVLTYLKSQLEEPGFNPEYLIVNCGLHDIKRNPKTNEIQINESEYRSNLIKIFSLLKRKKIKPIWISTTPVVDSIHNSKSNSFKRYATDIAKYNQIATEVCTSKKVPVINLFGFTKRLGVDQYRDHVHYKSEAQKLQANFIASCLETIIK